MKKTVRRVRRDGKVKNRTLEKPQGCGTLRPLRRFIYAPPAQWVTETGIAVPPPRAFLQKSLDLLDSKGVDAFESAKEFVRVSNDKS
jgi:hypothetical protein